MEVINHLVEFNTYCKTCQHYTENENAEKSKCHDCLENPVNKHSRKPVHWKEKE